MGQSSEPTLVAKRPFALYKNFLSNVCFQVKGGVFFYFSCTPFNYERLTAIIYTIVE